jgi:hypothetical protein
MRRWTRNGKEGSAQWTGRRRRADRDPAGPGHWDRLGLPFTAAKQTSQRQASDASSAHTPVRPTGIRARNMRTVTPCPSGIIEILFDRTAVRFRLLLDGQPLGATHGADTDEQGHSMVTRQGLPQLIRPPGPITDRTFEITFPDPGAQVYTFTFGETRRAGGRLKRRVKSWIVMRPEDIWDRERAQRYDTRGPGTFARRCRGGPAVGPYSPGTAR